MTYIIFLIVIVSFYFLIKCLFHRFSWFFLLISISLSALLYISFLLISINGNYSSIGYIFGEFDIKIFRSIIANRQSQFFLVRLFNLSSSIYLMALPLFIYSYFQNKVFKLSKYQVKMLVSSTALAIIYAFFYDPDVRYHLYCYSIDNVDSFLYVSIFDLFCHVSLYTILVLHIIYIINQQKTLVSRFKYRQSVGLIIFVLSADILYLLILRISCLRNLYLFAHPSSIINIRYKVALFKGEYAIYVLIMLIVIISMFVAINKCYLTRTDSIINNFLIRLQSKKMNKNLVGVFHSVKNIVLSYRMTLVTAQNAPDEERSIILQELQDQITEYVDSLSKMLNTYDIHQSIIPEHREIREILDESIAAISRKSIIQIEKEYNDNNDIVYVDSYYMVKAFNNLLQNAIDATLTKHSSEPIKVTTNTEFELTLISISDSGVGLNKKELSSIFKPFYTTKSRILNWGVGLSFVYNTIKAHNGNILVESKKDSGTDIHIILPHE